MEVEMAKSLYEAVRYCQLHDTYEADGCKATETTTTVKSLAQLIHDEWTAPLERGSWIPDCPLDVSGDAAYAALDYDDTDEVRQSFCRVGCHESPVDVDGLADVGQCGLIVPGFSLRVGKMV